MGQQDPLITAKISSFCFIALCTGKFRTNHWLCRKHMVVDVWQPANANSARKVKIDRRPTYYSKDLSLCCIATTTTNCFWDSEKYFQCPDADFKRKDLTTNLSNGHCTDLEKPWWSGGESKYVPLYLACLVAHLSQYISNTTCLLQGPRGSAIECTRKAGAAALQWC